MSGVDLIGVSRSYGSVEAVANLSLSIPAGQFVTLLGPSGSGKTTTMRMIAGLERPDKGVISIAGQVMSDGRSFVPTHRRRLGMVFQSYAIWPHKTVWENVAFPLQQQGISRREQAVRIQTMLERVGLSQLAERYPSQLSGGQQQRVSLARALVAEPNVILFDEPLSNLDAQLRDSMRALLADLHFTSGKTFIYVTHDQTEAMTLSDQVFLMDHGRVVQSGAPEDLYERPANRFVAEFIGHANVLKLSRHDKANNTVQLESGAVLHVAPISREPVENVLIIRPHDLRFVQAGTEPNAIEAAVTYTSYLGDRTRYAVDAGTGAELTVELPGRGSRRLRRGDRVRVQFPPEACMVI